MLTRFMTYLMQQSRLMLSRPFWKLVTKFPFQKTGRLVRALFQPRVTGDSALTLDLQLRRSQKGVRVDFWVRLGNVSFSMKDGAGMTLKIREGSSYRQMPLPLDLD
jgi:hypothetical protein